MHPSTPNHSEVPALSQRAEFVTYRPRIHRAHNQSGSGLSNTLKSFSTHYPDAVDSLVEVAIKHVNRLRGVSDELNESVVGHVVKRYGVKTILEGGEPEGLGSKNGRFLCSSTSVSESSPSVFGSRMEDRKVCVNLLTLRPTNLIESQASGVENCQSGEKRLSPGRPHFLAEAPPRYEPAAIVDRIGHVTSPVSMQGIVGRGCW